MTTITATLSSELVRLGSYKPVLFHRIGSLTGTLLSGTPLGYLNGYTSHLTLMSIHDALPYMQFDGPEV